jgi:hypothetical protein
MFEDPESEPFYLIVTDHDRGVFAVEGPMADDRPWQSAAREARNHRHRISCGPTGSRRSRWLTGNATSHFPAVRSRPILGANAARRGFVPSRLTARTYTPRALARCSPFLDAVPLAVRTQFRGASKKEAAVG